MSGPGDASNSAEEPPIGDGAAVPDHKNESMSWTDKRDEDVSKSEDHSQLGNDDAPGAAARYTSNDPAEEIMVVAEPESPDEVEHAVPDLPATMAVEGSETPEPNQPMAIADASPDAEPMVITESETPSESMVTTETKSANSPMVVAEPVTPAETDSENQPGAIAPPIEPLVVAEVEPDAESTVVSESVGDQAKPDPLVVADAAHAAEPMVVTETTPQATQEGSPTEASVPTGGGETTPPATGDVAAGGVPPQLISSRAPGDPGKIVEGVVTAVSADGVELTLDDGRLAFISRRNFGLNNESPDSVLSVGDRAHGAELSREDPKSRVVLSRSWALKKQAWDKIMAASTEGKPITGRVVSGSKKGVVVDVGVRGFVPMSHLELDPVPDLTPYIDQTFELKVLEVDPQKEKLVLSRRSYLLKAQRKQLQEIISAIKPGEVRTGKVSSFADYGAFVDLGGVSGLAHISELSWERVGKPSDILTLGQEVEVKVLDVKAKKKRISLSIRQTTEDPLSGFEVGSILNGPVTRLVDFGAFVLVQGFEGLVHLSELAEYRVSAPEEIVAPGDVVGVKVLSIDTKRRRLELSIRRAAEYQG